MSRSSTLNVIADALSGWQKRYSDEDLLFVEAAELGQYICHLCIQRQPSGDVFERLESVFLSGDRDAIALVESGMFEAMVSFAFRRSDPPELIGSQLGPLSRVAWGDQIESWAGEGIRTVALWRRVVVNTAVQTLRYETSSAEIALAVEADGCVMTHPHGQVTLSLEAVNPILNGFKPLLATAVIAEGEGQENSYDRLIELSGCAGQWTLEIGSASGGVAQIVRCNQMTYSVEMSALLEQLQGLIESA